MDEAYETTRIDLGVEDRFIGVGLPCVFQENEDEYDHTNTACLYGRNNTACRFFLNRKAISHLLYY